MHSHITLSVSLVEKISLLHTDTGFSVGNGSTLTPGSHYDRQRIVNFDLSRYTKYAPIAHVSHSPVSLASVLSEITVTWVKQVVYTHQDH